jgi:hypothetical protein
MGGPLTWGHAIWGLSLAASALLIGLAPAWAPLGILASLAGAIPPWARGWKAADGTALRGALAWVAVGIGLGIAAQAVAGFEPVFLGRPWAGRLTYLMVLAALAALISVLGARRPGSGAWSILMVLLVVVFLIPWLEHWGKVRRGPGLGQARLDSPWTLFYGLLVLAGVTNYLPTRYGPAAAALGLGLVAEYLGLTRQGWPPPLLARTWAFVAWSLSLGLWLASWSASRTVPVASPADRLWLWFRDHWGVVWALRIAERFNRTAEQARWPARLSWFGLAAEPPAGAVISTVTRDQALAALRNLIRRFATARRVDALLESAPGGSCHPDGTAE